MLKIVVIWTLIVKCLLLQNDTPIPNENKQIQNKENFAFNASHVILQSILLCGTEIVCDKSILTALNIPDDSKTSTGCPECSCSDSCSTSENSPTCCPDLFFKVGFLECRNTYMFNSLFSVSKTKLMVASCPYGANADLSLNCSQLPTDVDFFKNPPVQSEATRTTYKNKFCALCNNATNTEPMQPYFDCLENTDFNYFSSYNDIISAAKSRSCGIKIEGTIVEQRFCETDNFDKITSCNVTGSWRRYDRQIDISCQRSGYYAPVGAFRNIFCKMCNPPPFEKSAIINTCEYPSIFKNACLDQPLLEASFPYKNYFCFACSRGDNNTNFYSDVELSYDKEIYKDELFEFTIGFEYVKEHVQQYLRELRAMSAIQGNTSTEQGTELESSPSADMINLPNVKYACLPTTFNESSSFDPTFQHHNDIHYYVNITSLVYTSFALTRNGVCSPWLLPSYTLPLQKNCSCTVGCTTNCCDDFALKQKWTCISDRYSGSQNDTVKNFRAIGGCIQRIDEYEDYCTSRNFSHFYHTFPVSLTRGNKETYANLFCYLCGKIQANEIDNIDIDSVLPWPLKVSCPIFVNHRNFKSLQHLMNYLEESSCEVGFEPPIDAGKCSDVCSAKISSCNVSGTWNTYNEDVSVACENTDVLTFPPVKFNSIVYKNRFCLICNPTETHLAETDQSCTLQENSNLTKACLQFPNVHVCAGYKNIFCKMCNDINASNCIDVFYKEVIPSTTTPWPTIPPYTWSYRTYFSISSYEQSGILPVEDIYSNCLPNQIYDSSQKTCKNLTCFPGKTQMNDTCVALLASTQNLRYTLPVQIELTTLTYANATLKELMRKLRAVIETSFSNNFEEFGFYFENFILMTSSRCTTENIRHGHFLLYLQIFFDKKVIRNDLEIKLIEFTQLSTNWTLVDDIVVNVELSRSEKALSLPYLVWKVHKSQCIVLSDKKKCSSGMFKNALVSPLLRCKQVELKGNEFGVHWTKLRSTFSYLGLSLSSYHFAADATVQYRVCASDISIYKEKLKEMGFIDEGLPLSLLTLSCVCISLLFLVLAFTTYCLFPSLRTLPGINNMILMIFLFLAQMLLIVRPFFRSTGMVVLSALSHISWLLLFFWLQVCSFHMFRVFRQDRRTENSGSYIRKTITKYVSYAFGSSSFIVSCNLIISLIESNGKNTGYDNASSLMTHKISFIVTLILPLTLICLTNIMFYILTSYKIYSSPDIESTSRNRIQFTVYVKLFSLTGLSWLLQIVDTFIEVSILSYFVAILNGLQGFFIFLSYVCNKRVWNLYKKAFGSSFIDQSKTSSGRVTYSNEN